jgi:hypothetical protein
MGRPGILRHTIRTLVLGTLLGLVIFGVYRLIAVLGGG